VPFKGLSHQLPPGDELDGARFAIDVHHLPVRNTRRCVWDTQHRRNPEFAGRDRRVRQHAADLRYDPPDSPENDGPRRTADLAHQDIARLNAVEFLRPADDARRTAERAARGAHPGQDNGLRVRRRSILGRRDSPRAERVNGSPCVRRHRRPGDRRGRRAERRARRSGALLPVFRQALPSNGR
jgi:hypothetical protein